LVVISFLFSSFSRSPDSCWPMFALLEGLMTTNSST